MNNYKMDIETRENIRKTWNKAGNPLRGITSEQFIDFFEEWIEKSESKIIANMNMDVNKEFIKDLLYEYPEAKVENPYLESVNRLEKENSALLRKREEYHNYTPKSLAPGDLIEHLFEKKIPKSVEEQKRRKEQWEKDNWIIESQKQRLALGGLNRHIVNSGIKNPILPLDEKPKKWPKGNQYSETTQRMLNISDKRETPSSIRNLANRLRDTPLRKWQPIDMQKIQQYPEILEATLNYRRKKGDRI